jgi:hypothetical protein
MSSNPYVVRTDAYLGFLQKKDLIPQNIAVGKLKIDCSCSGLLQQLQNEYLNLFSTIPNNPKIGQLLRDIQEIQRLQTEFQANEYTSMKDIKSAHENLQIALNNIKSIPKKEGKKSYFQELAKNAPPPSKMPPPAPDQETDEQRESRLFLKKQQQEVEDSENKYNEEILAIEKKNKQDLIQLQNQRVARERNAERFRVTAENQKKFNDREITLRQKREQQAAQQLEHEKKIVELRKEEAESQNQLNDLQKRFHRHNVHPALPANQALPPLIPEGPKPYAYEDNLSILAMLLAENEEKTAELEKQLLLGNPQDSDYRVQMTMPEPPPLQMQRPEPPPLQMPRPETPPVGQENTNGGRLVVQFGGDSLQRLSPLAPPPAPPLPVSSSNPVGGGSVPGPPPPPPPPPAPGAMPKRADANPVETGQPSQTGNTAPPPKNAIPKPEKPVEPQQEAILAKQAEMARKRETSGKSMEEQLAENKAKAAAAKTKAAATAAAVANHSSGLLNVNRMIGMSDKMKALQLATMGASNDTEPQIWEEDT